MSGWFRGTRPTTYLLLRLKVEIVQIMSYKSSSLYKRAPLKIVFDTFPQHRVRRPQKQDSTAAGNVQPGEAHVVVPNEVVQRGGLYHIENIINMYDDGTSFASRNSGSRIIPNPPSMREPRVTVIPSETTSSMQNSNEVSSEIPMLDASFVSSRKLKTLGVV